MSEPTPPRRKIRRRKSAIEAKKKVSEALQPAMLSPSTKKARRDGDATRPCCQSPSACLAGLSDRCAGLGAEEDDGSSSGSGTSQRWLHITLYEHICQHCLDEFAKPGRSHTDKFQAWRELWTTYSRREPSHRMFTSEELSPYWVECCECGAWRCVSRAAEATPAFLAAFRCVDEPSTDCGTPEEAEVEAVGGAEWARALSAPGLLRDSPAVPFLNGEFFNDEVGLSPSQPFVAGPVPRDPALKGLMEPFYVPTESSKALCLRADVLEYDEITHFPEYASEFRMYLGLRNLAVALWNYKPTEWLELDTCSARTICRGMVRIHMVKDLARILQFLTVKGIINVGLVRPEFPLESPPRPERVLVIGAGISGLATAHQLRNFGVSVSLLEAGPEVGGRMQDDHSLGVVVGKGGQFVTGVLNNPITLMCLQSGMEWKNVGEACPLLDTESSGNPVSAMADRRVDLHFNCLLDGVAHWRKTGQLGSGASELSLSSAVLRLHRQLLGGSRLRWSGEEERLLQFQLGNVEFSCGADIDDVSSVAWDQNEAWPQFAGPHALLTHGGQAIARKLAKDQDIRFDSPVTSVDLSDPSVIRVGLSDGSELDCERVVVTVSLAVLQAGRIAFKPPLPTPKLKAITHLGAGCIEKVAVKFPHNFWNSKTKGADYFGVIPKDANSRGLFNMFYDFSDESSGAFVLMSYVCSGSLSLVDDMKEKDLVQVFVDILASLFPDEEIPVPSGWVISHWRSDPKIGMSYSYVRKGAGGDDYAKLAAPVDKRLYFAGEATNQCFPQTMTGAYLSGIREAAKVFNSIFHKNKINVST